MRKLQDEPQCDLFDLFSLYIQILLALISFSVLIYKRFKEIPKRPWKIWFYDVFKLICSSILLHFLNLLISYGLNKKYLDDSCKWYFVNLLLDTTLGVLTCYYIIKIGKFFERKLGIKSFFERTYFEKKNNELILIKDIYYSQLGIWILITFLNKLLIFSLIKLLYPVWSFIGMLILYPFKFNVKLELFMVMIIFPIILNAFQLWIFDNIIKLDDLQLENNLITKNNKNDNNIDSKNKDSEIKNETGIQNNNTNIEKLASLKEVMDD